MTNQPQTQFLVNPNSDPVAIRIEGKATFQNCNGIKDFMTKMVEEGKRRFVMDFSACTGMDSTFLGVMAGSALQLRKVEPRGSLVVSHLNERNHELVHNLGLNRLLIVDDAQDVAAAGTAGSLDTSAERDEIAAARQVLEAHRSLIEADGNNEAKFQDVINLCRLQLGEE